MRLLELFESSPDWDAKDVLTSISNDLSNLFDYYKKPDPASKQQLESGSIPISTTGTRKVTTQGKTIAIRLAEEVELDYLIGYEMYWNVQKSTTRSLVLNNTQLLTEVLEESNTFFCKG
jgi:hypothetical protein